MACRKTKLLLSWMLVIAVFLSFAPGALAASPKPKGKIINVVYDDSGSMAMGDTMRWSQAKYAMEVFCAMMGKEDVMNIFLMSTKSLALTVNGYDRNRVSTVHDMNSSYGNTPFSTVKHAAEHLLEADANFEKWLVIITDGAFDDGATAVSTVQNALDTYNAKGIKTVFLGLGPAKKHVPAGDPSKGAYVETANDGPEVLQKVTAIANQIFEHLILPSTNISHTGYATILDIDIPTSQIIVFGQGDDVSIGELTLGGKTIQASSVENVKWSDVKPGGYGGARVDTSLKGVVATFDAGASPFTPGEYSIEVENTNTIQYYYKPEIKVNCDLLYRGQIVRQGDELYAGDYEIRMNFVNPLDGKEIRSSLLDVAVFTLTADNNGQIYSVTTEQGNVSLEEGQADITVRAELPGHVTLSDSKTYRVLRAPKDLKLTFTPENPLYARQALKDGAKSVLLRVSDAESGETIGAEDWENTNITVSGQNGIDWVIAKGPETGTWLLQPTAKNEKKVSLGAVQFEVEAAFKVGSLQSHGSAVLPIQIEEYLEGGIKVELSKPETVYDLNEFPTDHGMTVKVSIQNPETGKYEPVDAELAKNLTLTANSDKKIGWKIEKGSAPGEWILYPEFYRGDPLGTDDGNARVTVEASGVKGYYRFRGSAAQDANFLPLSRLNRIKYLLRRIALALAALLILIGYLTKKRLRFRGLNPRCYKEDITSPRIPVKKKFWRWILPFVSERAIVSCHRSSLDCNFPNLEIESTGKWSFRIVNYKKINVSTVRIDGEKIENKQDLKKRKFSLSGFTISSINQYGDELGTFKFQ